MTTTSRSLRRVLATAACGFIFFCVGKIPLRAVTIETIDDKASTGSITALDNGVIVLQSKTAKAPATKIPLPDIIAINLSWQDRQSHTPPPATVPAIPATAPASQPVPPPPNTQPASQSKPLTKWRIELGNGDRLTAGIADWSDAGVTLAPDSLTGVSLSVPVEQVRIIWSTNAYQVKKAKDLKLTAQAQDIAFVEKDNDVKAVTGLATGIDGEFLKFKFEGEERKIKLDRLAGIMLAQRETTTEKSLYAAFNLINGDILSGKIQSMNNGAFQMVPLAVGEQAAPLDISLSLITKIEIHNGRLAWVGDLKPSSVSQAPYFDRLMPYQINQSLTGGPLVMSDGTVSKGIAVHSKCVLTYDIDGAYEHFRAKVGFQQPDGKIGRAAVSVIADGKVLWQDDDLKGDAKPTPLDLTVSGAKQLTLEVDYGKNQDVADRVIWGEPRLIKPAGN